MTPPPNSLVLVHGFASSFEHNWVQTGWVDILGDFGRTVPELDLPGHGSSPRSPDPGDYADVEGDLYSLLHPLPPPIEGVGFSTGAELLLRVAIAHPGCFDRLALLGIGDNVFEASDPSTMTDALEGDVEPEDVRTRLFYRLAHSTGNDPLALSAFLRRPRAPLSVSQLETVDCPVLVVLGDRDMIESADRLVDALPDASLVSLPGVDHFATPSEFGAIDATVRFLGLD
jgi:pimeloyl-ACP methyl ester carboxylesterase